MDARALQAPERGGGLRCGGRLQPSRMCAVGDRGHVLDRGTALPVQAVQAGGGGGRRRSSLRLAQGCARGSRGSRLGLLLNRSAVDSQADEEGSSAAIIAKTETEGVLRSI